MLGMQMKLKTNKSSRGKSKATTPMSVFQPAGFFIEVIL
jgi:hypothetical protein